MRTTEKHELEIAALGDLTRYDLIAMWQKTYGCPPPKGIKRQFLERSATWHLQAKKLGGLSTATKRALRVKTKAASASLDGEPSNQVNRSSINETDGGGELPSSSPSISASGHLTLASTSSETLTNPRKSRATTIASKPRPGTRLMREWNGRMHVVDVTSDSFVFDGKSFGSLSAVARRITGTRWSGPRFFGLEAADRG